MTTYSYAQLEQLWINAGGSKATAPVAAAIAEAESGGNPAALNPSDNGGTQTSVGLWQVSNGTHVYPSSWLTPAGNASEAVAKYQGAGDSFTPWGTYDSGAYRAFVNGSTTPDPNVPQASLTSATSTNGGGSDCLVGPVFGTCLLDKSEARALIGGLVVAGGLLVMGVGLALVAVFALNRAGLSATIVNNLPGARSQPKPRRERGGEAAEPVDQLGS